MAEMYSGLHVGQRFASLEEFKALVRSISVRQHWELRVTRSNKKSVVIGCRSSNNCYFRVVCRANKNSTYISSLQDSHNCRRNASSSSKTPTRSEVSHVRFLMTEIPKLFNMNETIKAQEVVDAVKRCHGYDISMRQAQRALIRLQQQPHDADEVMNPLNTARDDQQESQPALSEGHGDGSTYSGSGLSGPRWVPDLPPNLVDNEALHPSDIQRNSAMAVSSSHGRSLQTHHHLQHPHQIQPTPQIQHPTEVQPHDQVPYGHPIHHPSNHPQPTYAVPGTDPPAPQQGRSTQGQTQSSGHHASQLVFTNFKIEFTCTTCGALNQSFFPNQGNVTGGSYLSHHSMPEQTAIARAAGPSAQAVPGNDRVEDGHGYGDTTANTRNVQSPWTPGTLEVAIAPAHP